MFANRVRDVGSKAVELAFVIGTGLALQKFVGSPGVVQGASMMPTFSACCSVVWFSSLYRSLDVGDVVSANVSGGHQSEVGVVKRVRGVAGDVIWNEDAGVAVVIPEGSWFFVVCVCVCVFFFL
jgi:signal peptidase I